MLFRGIVVPAFSLLALLALCAQPRPEAGSQLEKTLAVLAKRCDRPRQYSWQGELTIEAREGDGAFLPAASAKAELAIGEEGKSLLKMEPVGRGGVLAHFRREENVELSSRQEAIHGGGIGQPVFWRR
jgi:hypothetical protein